MTPQQLGAALVECDETGKRLGEIVIERGWATTRDVAQALAKQSGLESYCTPRRFQWGFVQPVYVGSNQMQERPLADAPVGTDHDITFYQQQLAEVSAPLGRA